MNVPPNGKNQKKRTNGQRSKVNEESAARNQKWAWIIVFGMLIAMLFSSALVSQQALEQQRELQLQNKAAGGQSNVPSMQAAPADKEPRQSETPSQQTKEADFAWLMQNVKENPKAVKTLTIYDNNKALADVYVKADNSDKAVLRHFKTTIPGEIGSKMLLEAAVTNNVQVVAKSYLDDLSGPEKFLAFLFSPLGLLIAISILFFVMMSRRLKSFGGNGGPFGFTKSLAKIIEDTGITFEDVAGCDESMAELVEVVEYLRNPTLFQEGNARIPKGLLLVGPPGTGKTLLAKAVAGEAGVPFFALSGSDFVQMFVGVGAARVRDMFRQAAEKKPCIIFIDELDAIGRQRGTGTGGGHDEREQTLNQILVEMDGIMKLEGVVILAATNRPDVLDPALLRPGRFDRQVEVNTPDVSGRKEILAIHTRELKIDDDVDFEDLAGAMIGMSGADIANTCNEAAVVSVRKRKKDLEVKFGAEPENGWTAEQRAEVPVKPLTLADFNEGIDRAMVGIVRPDRAKLMDPQAKALLAFHEASHAVASRKLRKDVRVSKVTIIPRGKALGYARYGEKEPQFQQSRTQLYASMITAMAGRGGEQVFLNAVDYTGAENDIEQTTDTAKRMVKVWGMSQLGPVRLVEQDVNPFLGKAMAHSSAWGDQVQNTADGEILKLCQQALIDAKKLLTQERACVEALVARLLQVETVLSDEFEAICAEHMTSNEFVFECQSCSVGTEQAKPGDAASSTQLKLAPASEAESNSGSPGESDCGCSQQS